MNTEFYDWLIKNKPSDGLVYANDWWFAYYNVWQCQIFPMFSDSFCSEGHVEFEKIEKEIDSVSSIVGTHTSKSILHPVVKINYRGAIIVFRYNFYDYEIAVICDHPVNIPMANLFKSKRRPFYYQGFPDKYKVEDSYEDNQCRFIAGIDNHYQFYTFMYLLKRELLKGE